MLMALIPILSGAELDEVAFDHLVALQDSVDCESLVYPHDHP